MTTKELLDKIMSGVKLNEPELSFEYQHGDTLQIFKPIQIAYSIPELINIYDVCIQAGFDKLTAENVCIEKITNDLKNK